MQFYPSLAFLRKAQDLLATLGDVFARPATHEQMQLAERLRTDLRDLTSVAQDQLPFWRATTEQLLRHVENEDPRYFMRWPPIAGTMVPNNTPYALAAYRALRRRPDWHGKWKHAVIHRNFGHGPPFLANPRSSAITVEHATHLVRFKDATGRDLIDCAGIAEFGGGFGSMCRLTTRLGFRGRHVIFDLPPILALQRYFLGLHSIAAGYDRAERIVLASGLETVAATIPRDTALISTWALSEMPIGLREQIERFLRDDRTTVAMLAYQHAFEGIDNKAWFAGLMQRNQDLWDWHKVAFDANSDYLFGIRR